MLISNTRQRQIVFLECLAVRCERMEMLWLSMAREMNSLAEIPTSTMLYTHCVYNRADLAEAIGPRISKTTRLCSSSFAFRICCLSGSLPSPWHLMCSWLDGRQLYKLSQELLYISQWAPDQIVKSLIISISTPSTSGLSPMYGMAYELCTVLRKLHHSLLLSPSSKIRQSAASSLHARERCRA